MAFCAILFDLGDTLFRLHPMRPGIVEQWAAILTDAGVADDGRAGALARTALESLRAEIAEGFSTGRLEEYDVAEISRQRLESMGAPVSTTLAEELADVLGQEDIERFEAPMNVAARVEQFRSAGYRLGAVSNTTTRPALLEGYLARVGLLPLFDVMVFSRAVGIRKPHPDIYRYALRTLAAEPREAVFVGDRVREDVIGPQAIGMRAVLTHEYRQEDPALSQPLAVIGRIQDLWLIPGIR